MRRLNLGLVVGVVALAAVSVPSVVEGESPAAQTPTTTAPQPVQPKALRNGCNRLYTQRAFKRYTRKVYRREHVSRDAKQHTLMMQRCQHSPKAERNARAFRHKQIDARVLRARMYCGTPACNRELGRYIVTRRFGSAAFSCIDYIVGNESHWQHTIYNRAGSGAYGIPQALPGGKMASAGADWQTNPATQIKWMLGYVAKFGGPCGAASYWRSHHSY